MDRALPHNLDVERALLGSALLDSRVLAHVRGELSPDDFYSAGHRLIFLQMLDMEARSLPLETVSLCAELKNAGALEKAGGIAHIASLTDGVPVGDFTFAENYARIIKRESKMRALLNLLQNGQARVDVRGADPLEIAASLKADLEIISRNGQQPEPKPSERHGQCPTIERKCYAPLAWEYYELVEPTTEASRNFHLPAFMTLMGLALAPSGTSRKGSIYYVDSERLYPILYTVLVGTAGASKKGTAITKAARLARLVRKEAFGADDIVVQRSVDSAEGFKRKIAEVQGQGVSFRPYLIRLSELRSMLAKAARESGSNITSTLCEAYDRDPLEVAATKDPALTEEPWISFIAATSRKYMGLLSDTDIEGGLGSRVGCWAGEPKERIFKPPGVQQPAYSELVAKLAKVVQFWHHEDQTGDGIEFAFDREAHEMAEAFYNDLPAQSGDDEMMGALMMRFDHVFEKFAMINAALDYERVMKLQHVVPAIKATEALVRSTWYIFSEHGAPPWVETERLILKKIRDAGATGIRRRHLQQLMSRKCDAKQFNERVRALIESDAIVEVMRGKQKWLIATEWLT